MGSEVKMFDNGGSAFPCQSFNYIIYGMSWLDACAFKAMMGILSNRSDEIGNALYPNLARAAYQIAQAMLAEKRRLESGAK